MTDVTATLNINATIKGQALTAQIEDFYLSQDLDGIQSDIQTAIDENFPDHTSELYQALENEIDNIGFAGEVFSFDCFSDDIDTFISAVGDLPLDNATAISEICQAIEKHGDQYIAVAAMAGDNTLTVSEYEEKIEDNPVIAHMSKDSYQRTVLENYYHDRAIPSELQTILIGAVMVEAKDRYKNSLNIEGTLSAEDHLFNLIDSGHTVELPDGSVYWIQNN